MRTWEMTDRGMVRKENQDAYDVRLIAGYTSAVVCDGMGGTFGGRLASTTAAEIYQRELEQRLRRGMTVQQLVQVLHESISAANDAVRSKAAEDPILEHMGTTLVSALVEKNTAVVANVGDSRAYQINRSGIHQISRDHSVVADMVESGELTEEEARIHPRRNLITRALGPDDPVQADTFEVALQQGEFLLLCSDGLVNTVSDQEILFEVLHNGEPDSCLERLVALSKQRGAPDNVTAVLLMNM